MKKFLRLIAHPTDLILALAAHGMLPVLSDKKYLQIKFKKRTGYKLNLRNPTTFNEKLQWLKLYDHNPEYTKMVDKYEAKAYVASIIGEEYIIPTLGVWERFEDIDLDKLPNQFVLKCTHDSGGIVICKNKSTFDISAARRKLNHALKMNFYLISREWPYKNVHPRIIAEPYMTENSDVELKDYKIFNCDDEPKVIQIDYKNFVEQKRNLYTIDWKYIEAVIQFPATPIYQIESPKQLKKMLELARILLAGVPHVRTDFYCIEDNIYFAELTFYP